MKKKVLCLHGYSMNDAWMGEWCAPFAAALPELELLVPCAPIAAPEEEVRAMCQQFNMPIPEMRIGPGKNWCWYRASDDKPPVYRQIDESLTMLAELFRREPIDGVLGWSQGTVMAAILAALCVKEQAADFRFNWVVLCGGFRPGDTRFRHYFDTPIGMPSLHVLGERESQFMQEQGQRLADSFLRSQVLHTPVGHILPLKYPDYMQRIADWMQQASAGKTE